MDFFNKIGDIANKTGKKTGDLAKEAKIRMKINENKGKINDLYKEIGKLVYQNHIHGEEVKFEGELNDNCNKIDTLSKEIEKAREEILTLKNKRICENCYTEIELNARYCPHCGFEQAEVKVEDIKEEVPEAEILDKEQQAEEIAENAEENASQENNEDKI